MGSSLPLANSAELGRQIRDKRNEYGMKQYHLARKAGISREELSRIERGRVTPLTKTLQRICTALGVPLGALLEGRGN